MRLLMLSLLSLVAFTQSAGAQATETPQVIVTGNGVVKATPNQAWVTIGAETRSKTSKDAQQRNANAMAAIQQTLTNLGVPKEAIKTIAIDLQLEFDFVDGKQTPRGYVARNTIEVRIDKLDLLGGVLDAVVSSGATTIQSLRFDVSERDQLLAAALQAAVKDGIAKAQAIASGAGRAIDRVIKIEELGGNEPVPMTRQYLMSAKAENSTPVVPGELEIRAAIKLTAGLK